MFLLSSILLCGLLWFSLNGHSATRFDGLEADHYRFLGGRGAAGVGAQTGNSADSLSVSGGQVLSRQEAEAGKKAELARVDAANAEAEKQVELERVDAAKAAAEKQAELKRVAQAKAEAERQAELEWVAAEKAEAERQAELERVAAAKAEAERQAELERVAAAKAEAERQAQLERVAAAKAEAERQVTLRNEAEAKVKALRQAALKREVEARERAELQRAAEAKAEAERQAEQQRVAEAQAEARRLADLQREDERQADLERIENEASDQLVTASNGAGVPIGASAIAALREQEIAQLDSYAEALRFDRARWNINKSAQSALDGFFEVLFLYPDIEVNITVRSQDSRDPSLNLILSQQRAKTIRRYLTGRGLETSQFSVAGAPGPVSDVLENTSVVEISVEEK